MTLRTTIAVGAGALIIMSLATATAYQRGFSDGGEKERGAQALAVLASNVSALGVQGQVNASALRHAERQTAANAASREIDHEIAEVSRDPAYDDICISADGVRWLDQERVLANGGGLPSDRVAGATGHAVGIPALPTAGGRLDEPPSVPDQP